MDVSVKNIGGDIETYRNGNRVDNTININWLDSKFGKPKDPRKLKENRLIEIPSNGISDEEDVILIQLQTSNGSIISRDIENTLVVPRLFVNGEERAIRTNFKWLIDGVDQLLNKPFININKQYFSNDGDIIQLSFEYDGVVDGTTVMQRVDNFHGNMDIIGDNNGDNNGGDDTVRENVLDFSSGYKAYDGFVLPQEAIQLSNVPNGYSTHQNFWNLKFYEDTEKVTTYWFDKTFRVDAVDDYKFVFDFQYMGNENINGLHLGVNILYSDNILGGDSSNPVYNFNEDEFTWDLYKREDGDPFLDFEKWLIDIPVLSMGQNNYSIKIPPTDYATNVWLLIRHPYKNTETDSFISLQKISLVNE